MGLTEATADIDVARDAIMSATSLEELKQQLADNLFPVIKGISEATIEELVSRDEVIATLAADVEEIIDGEGDILQPDTSQKILGVFEAGKVIATELEQLLAKADQITRKRCAPLIKSYRQGTAVMTQYLTEITVPFEPDEATPAEDDGSDDEPDAEGDGDSDAADGETP